MITCYWIFSAPSHTYTCQLLLCYPWVNTFRPRQNGRHFAHDIFKCIFLNENASISIKISLKFVSKGPINNIPAFVQIMAWCRPGDKPLSEPMMVNLPTQIWVTRPRWVNAHGEPGHMHAVVTAVWVKDGFRGGWLRVEVISIITGIYYWSN